MRPGENRNTRCSFARAIRNRKFGWAAAPALKARKSEFGAHESFPIAEFEEKLQDILDGAEKLYYRLGVNTDLDTTIIQKIAQMRALNRKPIHPPRTIIDPATIVHEMRVLKVC